MQGFPDISVGKESTCNAGDPGLIPGSGRSPGEGIVYPPQYSWASLVAQLVKNPPAMRETWVWSLGWEDPLEKGKATHSSIPAWRIPWTIKSMGSQSQTQLSDFHFTFHFHTPCFCLRCISKIFDGTANTPYLQTACHLPRGCVLKTGGIEGTPPRQCPMGPISFERADDSNVSVH